MKFQAKEDRFLEMVFVRQGENSAKIRFLREQFHFICRKSTDMCKKCNNKHKYTEKNYATLTDKVILKWKYIKINCVCSAGYTGCTANTLV